MEKCSRYWNRWRRTCHTACLLFAALNALASEPSSAQSNGPFTFGLIGDTAYDPSEEVLLTNLLDDLNNDSGLSFVAHVGDLSSEEIACSDSLLTKRFKQFQASVHPFIYTPGDNEWVDCSNPLARLTKLRSVFFATNRTLGQNTFALRRQSSLAKYSKYRENARWDMGGVTFLTLHIPGSNNGLGHSIDGDAEYNERNAANLAWLKLGFEHAKTVQSRAVMVIQQADMFPQLKQFLGHGATGFEDTKRALKHHAESFGKPVVLVHGDSHFFRIDKPFSLIDELYWVNFTRVETFGSPFHHWIHVTVDPANPDVFSFSQRIVQQNVFRR